MEKDIKVSVFCVTYNHEKYIKDALESFLRQTTNFEYEIIVHDDCSTDDTTQIIKDYEKKYPNKIKAIYQKENVYKESQYLTLTYMYKIFRGKYIAFCEGDDYWIDSQKLQKQYEILEKQPQCSICVGKTCVVKEKQVVRYMPDEKINLKTGIVSNKIILNMFFGNMPHSFQTASYFIKKEVMEELYKLILQNNSWINWTSGDKAILKTAWNIGEIFYLNDELAAYRINVIGSATDLVKRTSKKQRAQTIAQHIYSDYLFDSWTSFKYHNVIQKKIISDGIALGNMDACIAKNIFEMCDIKYKDCLSNCINWKNFFRYVLIMNMPDVMNKLKEKRLRTSK